MITTESQGLSYIQYRADGVESDFVLVFPYLYQANIFVYVDGVATTAFTWLNASEIQMDVVPSNGQLLTIKRITQRTARLVDFTDGGVIRERNLDLDSDQIFYLAQEAIDLAQFALIINNVNDTIDAQGNRIINVADGVDATDAVTKQQLDAVQVIADAAAVDAAAAVVTANAIADTANTALANSAAAVITANAAAADAAAAVVTANGIAATANAALVAANAAVVTAGLASADASAALAAVVTAQADATLALANAAAAQAAADAAQATADAAAADVIVAQAAADAAQGEVDALELVVTANDTANNKNLFTGLISGGTVTINVDPTKFDVAAGTGIVVDSWTDPLNVTKTLVSWSAFTAVPTTYLATNTESYISINSAGAIVQSAVEPSPLSRRQGISLVKLAHTGSTIINNVTPSYNINHAHFSQFRDFVSYLNYINEGNWITPNGANLSINKSVGSMLGLGINDNDQTNPNIKSFGSQVGATFQYRTRTGVATGNLTSIVPASYDVGGVVTTISGSNNQATNQRIYLTASGLIRIQYGQTVYSTLAAAIEGLRTETFVEFSNLTSSGALIGILSVTKGATNLSITSTAKFINPSRFGEVSAGASGISVSTLQQAYDNSATPEIVTDTTRGAMTVKRGSAADTDDVIEVLDGAGVTVASITGEGNSVLMGVKNPRVLESKRDTYANLVTYAALGTSVNGQFVFSTDTKKMYHIVDNVLTELGGGGGAGVGGVDILFAQTFETTTLPEFTQDGMTLSSTTPIHGTVSALLTHHAVDPKFFKQVVAVDEKFRGQAMLLELNVKSTATAGNVSIKIYDETNAANIVASEQLTLSSATGGIKDFVSFTIPATCLSLSYTITANPETGALTRIDDVLCQLSNAALLETSVTVPNITSWQSFVPTGTWTTNTTYTGRFRQIGESYEYQMEATLGAGAPNAATLSFNLPSGHVIDTSKFHGGLVSTYPSIPESVSSIRDTGVATYTGTVTYNSTTSVNAAYLNSASTYVTPSSVTNAFPITFGALDTVAISFSVPVLGLTATSDVAIPLTQSGIVQEADSEMILTGGTLAASAGSIATGFSVSKSTGSALLSATNRVTALVAGQYSVAISADSNSTTGLQLFVNGAAYSPHYTYVATGGSQRIPLTQVVTLKVNDYVEVRQIGAVAATSVTLSVSRQGSLKQVTVNTNSKITIPTSEVRFEGASARGAVATAIVKFDTMAKIRGDAFTVTNTANDGTAITMTKAGKLDVGVTIYRLSAGNVQITKNQSVLTAAVSTAAELMAQEYSTGVDDVLSVSWTGFVNVGDIFRIASSTTPTANFSNNLNLSFQEQDIQVSVSNTLPQFSESDSSVRVDTTNGYGSAGTKIRRFSNVRDNIGTDIEYVDSATAGASFTAKTSGIYSISYSDSFTTATTISLTKNQSNLTSPPVSVPVTERLTFATTDTSSSFGTTTSWDGYLVAGDVIRPCTDGSAAVSADRSNFTMSKVGKPNVTGVDVTPFVNVPQPDKQSGLLTGGAFIAGATVTGTLGVTTGSGIFSYNSTTGIYTILKTCSINLASTAVASTVAAVQISIARNGAQVAAGNSSVQGGGFAGSASYNGVAVTGDTFVLTIQGSGTTSSVFVSILATATSDSILTAPETFSTDTAALTYAGSGTYTLATLANAPVGTFITYTTLLNTNSRTQTTTAPTQTVSHMNANGIQVFPRAFNITSTAALPATIAIQIGKGMKGINSQIYTALGKATAATDEFVSDGASSYGCYVKNYNESTGVLIYSPADTISSNTSTRAFIDVTGATSTSGYLVINASKNPALVGVGIDRVAARGVQSSGQSIPNTGSVATMTYDAVKIYDTHGALNAATGVFTSPVSGYYQVNGCTLYTNIAWAVGNVAGISVVKNGAEVSSLDRKQIETAGTLYYGAHGSDIIYLNKGDTCSLGVYNTRTAGATALHGAGSFNYFSIAKISGIN